MHDGIRFARPQLRHKHKRKVSLTVPPESLHRVSALLSILAIRLRLNQPMDTAQHASESMRFQLSIEQLRILAHACRSSLKLSLTAISPSPKTASSPTICRPHLKPPQLLVSAVQQTVQAAGSRQQAALTVQLCSCAGSRQH